MNNLSGFLYKSLTIFLLISFILMGLSSFGYLEEIKPGLFLTKIIQLTFIFLILLSVFYVLIKKDIPSRYFLWGLLLVSFVLRLVFILQNKPDQVSDFLYMYKQAMELVGGNQDALKTEYYNFAIFNTPFTIYESYLLKWFGSVELLKVLNVIYSTLIVFFIYKIGQSIFGERVARIAGFIASIFPPFIIYNAILTNQTLSILFILVGIYFIVNRKYVSGGLFLGLGQIFRPIGIMFLVGSLAVVLWEWCNRKEHFTKKQLKELFLTGLKLIIPYYIILFSVSGFLTSFNYTEHGLFHNPTPSYKFLVGLNQETQGSYSESDNELIYTDLDNFEKIAKEKINERTSNLSEVFLLFENKFEKMWGSKDASFFWADLGNNKFTLYTQLIWIFILFSGGSLIFFLRRKAPAHSQFGSLYIFLVLLGFIGIYFLIEIQPRYRYEIYPLFILVSSLGCFHILETIKNKIEIKTVKIVSLSIFLLFVFTLIPDSVFQRTIEKEIPSFSNAKVIEVNQPLNNDIQIKQLHFHHPNDSITSIIIELNHNVKVSDISKYAMTIRAGLPEESQKELMWDFRPTLYKSGNIKYVENTLINAPDSVVYLNLALYDRDGFKGFKGFFVKVKNVSLR